MNQSICHGFSTIELLTSWALMTSSRCWMRATEQALEKTQPLNGTILKGALSAVSFTQSSTKNIRMVYCIIQTSIRSTCSRNQNIDFPTRTPIKYCLKRKGSAVNPVPQTGCDCSWLCQKRTDVISAIPSVDLSHCERSRYPNCMLKNNYKQNNTSYIIHLLNNIWMWYRYRYRTWDIDTDTATDTKRDTHIEISIDNDIEI